MTPRSTRPQPLARLRHDGALVAVASALALAVPAAAEAAEAAPVATGSIAGTVTAAKAKHVKDTLVFIKEAPGEFPPPAAPIDMDQVETQFVPARLTVLKGTTVRYKNSDPFDHSVYSPDGEKFDLGTWGFREERTHTYQTLGVYTMLCNLHPRMVGYVAVLQNPYSAWTDETGKFTIAQVPPGSYTLQVWNERRVADPVQIEVKVGAEVRVDLELH